MRPPLLLVLLVTSLLILPSLGAGLVLGARDVGLDQVVQALGGGPSEDLGVLVVRKRLERGLFALVAGAALAVSGALMQAVTRNPVADPGVLGVNTGASFLVVLGIALGGISSPGHYVALALLGAGAAAILVYGLGSLGADGPTPLKLALAGTAVSVTLSALISAFLLVKDTAMQDFRFWQVGSTGGGSFRTLGHLLPWIIGALGLAIASAPSLNALALGDHRASSLGVPVGLTRGLGALAGVVLCGVVTAFAGPIGFVGLLAAHLSRALGGQDLRASLPLAALLGALMLSLADTLGRFVLRPREVEVGLVMAFVGAPVLVWVALGARSRT